VYILSDDEVTFDEDETGEHLPTRTHIWVDQGKSLATLLEPGSGTYCGHIAEHPAESLLGPRVPIPQLTVVSDSQRMRRGDW
jgi:hypothetical protein